MRRSEWWGAAIDKISSVCFGEIRAVVAGQLFSSLQQQLAVLVVLVVTWQRIKKAAAVAGVAANGKGDDAKEEKNREIGEGGRREIPNFGLR